MQLGSLGDTAVLCLSPCALVEDKLFAPAARQSEVTVWVDCLSS